MSFTEKRINVTFKRKSGNFTGSQGDTLSLSGFRVSLHKQEAGGVSMGLCQIRVYGMTQSQMNDLSTLGVPPGLNPLNEVSVQAGDASGMSTVFAGTINGAYADYSNQPAVSFMVEAYVGTIEAITPVPPFTQKGSVSVDAIMGSIAKQMGLKLENNGVKVKLTNPYFPGTAWDQMQACAQAGDFFTHVDKTKMVLAIWPKGGARQGDVTVVSPETGMRGYPSFALQSIIFETEFNPNIVYAQKLQVKSSLQPASGFWVPVEIETELESQTPGGAWFQRVRAYAPGVYGQ